MPGQANQIPLTGHLAKPVWQAISWPSHKMLKLHLLKTKSTWLVRFGAMEWAKYTYARANGDPLRLLGSAHHGLQVGALAMLGNEFVLVVGDHMTHLSKAENKKLASLCAHAAPKESSFLAQSDPARVAPTVTVVIKRRRVPVLHKPI